jgi:hypothetical protein
MELMINATGISARSEIRTRTIELGLVIHSAVEKVRKAAV